MSAQQSELNIDELKSTIKYIVGNNATIQQKGLNPVAINVESEAGIGKTTSIEQTAKELGMELVKISLAEIEEIGDLVGFPIKEYEVINPEHTEEPVKWVPENLLPTYLNSNSWKVTGGKRMGYAPPSWIQGKEKPIMLLLDDYSRGDFRFMQATMSIIDRQEYISWRLPKGSLVILSSNPDNGDYHVTTLDNAQKTRFISFNLKFDIECWARYAEGIGLDTRCINFLLMHPEVVKGKTNARIITNFFNSISSISDFDKDLPLIQLIGEGSVGTEFSTMFSMFINNKLDKLISPHEILTAPKWDTVHDKLWAGMGKGASYRADIGGVMTTRIINYTLHYAENNAITKAITDRLTELMTTENLFTNDLRYFMVKSIVNGNKTKFQSLMMNQDIVQMAIK